MKDNMKTQSNGAEGAMTLRLKQRSVGRSMGRPVLRPIAAGCAMLLTSLAVHAQQAGDTMVVTGIRASIESAIAVKKEAVGVVEAIAPEDLGKLPDASIADSINRLPGVAGQRNSEGRSQQLSIRGMPPDFSTTLLNGREQVNPNDSRGVEYDAYPSELINGVRLYKSPDATLMGQGISGTVDMQSIRPLSLKKRQIVLGVGFQQPSDGVGPTGDRQNLRFSYVDQFNGVVGIALGYARSSGTSYSRETSFWDGMETFSSGERLPFGKNVSLGNIQNKTTREGFMGVLEFKPNRNFHSTIDVYSSTTDREEISRKLLFTDMQSGTLSNATVANGFATSGTITNRGTDHILQAIGKKQKDENFAIGWNNKLRFGDASTIMLDLSKSKSTRKETIIDSNARIAGANTALTFDTRGGFPTFTNGFDFAGASGLTLGSIWGNGWMKMPTVTDELNSVRLEYNHAIGGKLFSDWTVGINVSDRSKVLGMTEGSIDPGANTLVPRNGTAVAGFNGGVSIPTWNSLQLLNGVYTYTDMGNQWWAQNKNWRVDEKVRTIYSKLDIDTSVSGMKLRGNVGVQVVEAEQSSSGAANITVATWGNGATCPGGGASVGGNCYAIQQTGGVRFDSYKYTDVLPSLNLALSMSNDQILRLGAGKMVARPTMRDLRANALVECWSPSANPTSCSGNRSGSGGNPVLEPFRANTIDIGYEKYFGRKAYVGAAAFFRKLDTFIYTETTELNFVNPLLGSTAYPTTRFSMPRNGQGGTISGIELTANLPLDLLTPSLSGFGVYISHSNTNSSVNIPNSAGGSADKMEMPGLSKRVTNLSVYYEKAGFSARLGQRSRSDFIGEITTNEYERQYRYKKAENIIDMQLGYEFREGTFKGLSVFLQANNLTNAAAEEYAINANGQREPKQKITYGRSFMLSAAYKF